MWYEKKKWPSENVLRISIFLTYLNMCFDEYFDFSVAVWYLAGALLCYLMHFKLTGGQNEADI